MLLPLFVADFLRESEGAEAEPERRASSNAEKLGASVYALAAYIVVVEQQLFVGVWQTHNKMAYLKHTRPSQGGFAHRLEIQAVSTEKFLFITVEAHISDGFL